MFAVVKIGSLQYKVKKGDEIKIEKIKDFKLENDKFILDKVLLLNDGGNIKIGKPFLENVSVQCSILGEVKGEKKVIFKYKPKKRYRRKKGHRQEYFKIKIEDIVEK
ncbi:MAG: 50S ribosomal protein L21 [Candidatus Pacebacteria bacterium]|nr:50S ribosomal protein L21 [Candidatus Paceibacterota bacterium]